MPVLCCLGQYLLKPFELDNQHIVLICLKFSAFACSGFWSSVKVFLYQIPVLGLILQLPVSVSCLFFFCSLVCISDFPVLQQYNPFYVTVPFNFSLHLSRNYFKQSHNVFLSFPLKKICLALGLVENIEIYDGDDRSSSPTTLISLFHF